MALRQCFKQYDLILFDMDGVITSEDAYFTAAVLAAYEFLHPDTGESAQDIMRKKEKLRTCYLQGEKTNARLKELAYNTNWDLAYLLYMMGRVFRVDASSEDDVFTAVYRYFCTLTEEAPKLYDVCADLFCKKTGYPREDAQRLGPLWKTLQDSFQAWYLGDTDYEKQYGKKPDGIKGKPGLIPFETPQVPMDALIHLFEELKDAGVRLGVGTGRPVLEIEKTLQIFGLYDRFDSQAFVTFTDITQAEQALYKEGIVEDFSKPHPYIFLKGALGKNYDDLKLYRGQYDAEKLRRVLVVGDAGADGLAAKRGGLDFAAVLTGVTGKAGASYFRKIGADYILDSVLDLMDDAGGTVEILC